MISYENYSLSNFVKKKFDSIFLVPCISVFYWIWIKFRYTCLKGCFWTINVLMFKVYGKWKATHFTKICQNAVKFFWEFLLIRSVLSEIVDFFHGICDYCVFFHELDRQRARLRKWLINSLTFSAHFYWNFAFTLCCKPTWDGLFKPMKCYMFMYCKTYTFGSCFFLHFSFYLTFCILIHLNLCKFCTKKDYYFSLYSTETTKLELVEMFEVKCQVCNFVFFCIPLVRTVSVD